MRHLVFYGHREAVMCFLQHSYVSKSLDKVAHAGYNLQCDPAKSMQMFDFMGESDLNRVKLRE